MAKLSAEVIQSAVSGLETAISSTIIENIVEVKGIIDSIEDDNAIVPQILDGLKSYQANYNNSLPAFQNLIKSFKEVDEVREALEKKANMGEVRKVEASFNVEHTDASSVIL